MGDIERLTTLPLLYGRGKSALPERRTVKFNWARVHGRTVHKETSVLRWIKWVVMLKWWTNEIKRTGVTDAGKKVSIFSIGHEQSQLF